jgi:DNA polymerase-4
MRTILHSDANCFYASVEMLHHPEYRNLPMAVGGDPETRHGIILTANYIAKRKGVRTGSALWEAKETCPGLVILPPNYDQYLRFSRYLREIYGEYTDRVEAFGLDECWLDVGESSRVKGDGEKIAREINQRVKKELGLTVSVGVSWNKIFAKFGSDYRKPDAVTCVSRENYRQIVWNRPVSELLYVGRSTSAKLRKLGISTIGELAESNPDFLNAYFGKMGRTLSIFANGEDRTPVSFAGEGAPVKSIGNGMTMPYDLRTDEEVRVSCYMLAENVARRLRENGFAGDVVEMYVRDSELHGLTRQHRISMPTNISCEIAEEAFRLFRKNYRWEKPIRGICVRVSNLTGEKQPYQLCLFRSEAARKKQRVMDQTVETIRTRFGDDSIRRGLMAFGPRITPRKRQEQVIHPLSYFQKGNLSGA